MAQTLEKIKIEVKSSFIKSIELSILLSEGLSRGERITVWFINGKAIEYYSTGNEKLIGEIFLQLINLDESNSTGKFYDKFIKKNMNLNFKNVG